jgi:hypothetical protein
MKKNHQFFFKTFPKTNKIMSFRRDSIFLRILFPLIGLAAFVWFLIRVIPKPERATYPCMRAVAPIMSSFIIWILSISGMTIGYRNAKRNFVKSKYLYSSLFVFLLVLFLGMFAGQYAESVYANFFIEPVVPLSPTGTGKGIFPGRVAWVHNPNAAQWTGSGNYWAASVNPQAEYDKTFTEGIKCLSGGTNDLTSWDLIFKWFNNNHGRAGTGYQAGDKIAIKINQNNTAAPAADCGTGSNANAQSCVACLRSLVNAGVPQSDIWIGDPSRAVTDNIYNFVHSAYPNVNVVDYFGNNGRVTTSTVANAFPNSDVSTGESACFYYARYIINMPLMKGHQGQGITFGSKNFYGINGINPNWQVNNRHPGNNALTNYMTNASFGGKTILWYMDAMYPNQNLNGIPSTSWSDVPFNGKPAASFFMSLDGVAEESVSLDFFYQHYESEINASGGMSSVEAYIINAANSGAGVHEHWNDGTKRQYSRNLDSTVNGIEMVYINASLNNPLMVEEKSQAIPSDFVLEQNYPNPFNPTTNIRYGIPKEGYVSFVVRNVRGQEVVSLVNQVKPSGYYEVAFDGSKLSSGIYFYMLKVNGYKSVKKMILLK